MSNRRPRNPRDTERDTQPGIDGAHARRGRRTAREPQARRDNQQQLGVNPEHKTETMRRRHRGTFP